MVIRMWWYYWIILCLRYWIIMIGVVLMYIFSMHTPWGRLLRKPWVVNVYSAIVICRKLDGVIPMFTSVITITIKTR